ncbi:olfactory receptor 7C1-like [Panthera uncia]|uniref:olfactory receptor 7C1-like n=1 Tax=Panthera uncia TaxID=29064 RepID=UPI0020FF89F4|nr:olfactory receptor 7C1-like [Panthera uncia]
MEPRNHSRLPVFLLLGLSEKPEIQSVLFGLFLSLYLVTVFGNLLIILAIISHSHLHTPMYFFLANLSFSDICFTSTTVPKMLLNIQTQSKVITYAGCIAQMYFFTVFGLLDNLLLTAMAYDRFVAVCHPLHYTVIMNPQLCAQLLALTWLISALGALPESLTMLRLSFCAVIEIPHYFCELPEVLQLACSDTFINNVVLYIVTGMMGFVPLAGILFSYSRIVSSVLRISTAGGKYKAFSTCGSHLSVVSLFYGTCLGVYLSSTWTRASQTGAFASVLYTVVTPMMNPFIYSLRNRDMKRALRKLLCSMLSPQGQQQ